jgi:hypothetical protein
MGRLTRSLLLFLAVFLILLGAVFVIAGGMANISTGVMLVLIAVFVLIYDYRSQALAAKAPVEVKQTVNISMEAGGSMQERQLRCKGCGAPLRDEDLKLVEGGIMATCQYCRSVTSFEEAPKW